MVLAASPSFDVAASLSPRCCFDSSPHGTGVTAAVTEHVLRVLREAIEVSESRLRNQARAPQTPLMHTKCSSGLLGKQACNRSGSPISGVRTSVEPRRRGPASVDAVEGRCGRTHGLPTEGVANTMWRTALTRLITRLQDGRRGRSASPGRRLAERVCSQEQTATTAGPTTPPRPGRRWGSASITGRESLAEKRPGIPINTEDVVLDCSVPKGGFSKSEEELSIAAVAHRTFGTNALARVFAGLEDLGDRTLLCKSRENSVSSATPDAAATAAAAALTVPTDLCHEAGVATQSAGDEVLEERSDAGAARLESLGLPRQETKASPASPAAHAGSKTSMSMETAWRSITRDLPHGLLARLLDAEVALLKEHAKEARPSRVDCDAAETLGRVRLMYSRLEGEAGCTGPVMVDLLLAWCSVLASALDVVLRAWCPSPAQEPHGVPPRESDPHAADPSAKAQGNSVSSISSVVSCEDNLPESFLSGPLGVCELCGSFSEPRQSTAADPERLQEDADSLRLRLSLKRRLKEKQRLEQHNGRSPSFQFTPSPPRPRGPFASREARHASNTPGSGRGKRRDNSVHASCPPSPSPSPMTQKTPEHSGCRVPSLPSFSPVSPGGYSPSRLHGLRVHHCQEGDRKLQRSLSVSSMGSLMTSMRTSSPVRMSQHVCGTKGTTDGRAASFLRRSSLSHGDISVMTM